MISQKIAEDKNFGDEIGHDQFVHPVGSPCLTGNIETGFKKDRETVEKEISHHLPVSAATLKESIDDSVEIRSLAEKRHSPILIERDNGKKRMKYPFFPFFRFQKIRLEQ